LLAHSFSAAANVADVAYGDNYKVTAVNLSAQKHEWNFHCLLILLLRRRRLS